MNILSLFDGIGAARLACDRAGIKVDNYFASEIDEDCIKVCRKNFSDVEHIGDIRTIDLSKLPKIDLVIGGSSCQFLSVATRNKKGFVGQSSLFYSYVEIVKKLCPEYFLLENVYMKKEHEEVIDKALGVKSQKINSKLVSGQHRRRNYWFNWSVNLPKDKGISLGSILENGYTEKDKSYCMLATYARACVTDYIKSSMRQMIFTVPVKKVDNEYYVDGRIISKSDYQDLRPYLRKLTHIECERLQTLPDFFTSSIINKRKRYSAIGNSFTVDVVSHILKGL